jgi:hypothetical protein
MRCPVSLQILAIVGTALLVGAAPEGDGVTHDPALEQIPSEEAAQIKNIVGNTIGQMRQRYPGTDPILRGVHPKDHGCVTAAFKVRDDLPEDLRVGVFAKPGREYQTYIRFSNADVRDRDDSPPVQANSPVVKHGSRGMAIKLLGVEGTPLVEAVGPLTQDFLMVNHPVFAFANVEDYNVLSEILLKDNDEPGRFFKERVVWDTATGKPSTDQPLPMNKRALRTMQIAARIQSLTKPPAFQDPPASPEENSYYSAAPYLLGPDKVMKFRVKPVAPASGAKPDAKDRDYLRHALCKRLKDQKAGPVVFEFQVQIRSKAQLAGKLDTEIENACTEWDDKFKSVATVTIPLQEFDTEEQRKHCESLTFTPWHGIREHQPLGGINRLKLEVYKASTNFRHVPKEPAGY